MKHEHAYTRPEVTTVSAQDVVDALGPAHADHCYHEDEQVSGSRLAGRGRR